MTSTEELRRKIHELAPDLDIDAAIAEVRKAWDAADENQREEMDLSWRGPKARTLSLEGWCHFYWCMMRREYPDAHMPVARNLIKTVKTKRSKMVQAWRGFGKSTDLLLFVLWMVGINPVGSTGFVRINDTKAQLTGDLIAEMIETHRGWKACFPNVIPDKAVGWSSEKGYNVQDTNVTGLPGSKEYAAGYSRWRQMCLSDHPTESSIMCAGIESGLIIGWHPTNGMYFDDLHDERNTRSAAEMQKVVDILEGNIIPTWFTPKGRPIMACVCTPWDSERDAYHSMLQTGLFDLVQIPIFTEDENGERVPETVEFEGETISTGEWAGKHIKLTWPEAYPLERVFQIFRASTSRFFQMYLLDDKAAAGVVYVYRTFPAHEIQYNEWPITTGADPTSSVTGVSKGKGKSHYAFAHVYETPYNNLVCGGGYVKKVASDVGEQALANFSRTHSNLRAVSIESNSAGAAGSAKKAIDAATSGFIARNVGLVVHFHGVSELGTGSKIIRQFRFLEPILSNGILLIAEGPTGNAEWDEFLRLVKSALKRYPNFGDDEPEADVMDALCMAVLDLPRVWTRVHTNVATQNVTMHKRSNALSPVKELGAYSYLRG